MYRSDVETLVPPVGSEEIAGGSLVTVMDGRGIPLGTGLYSSASQIAARMVSAEVGLTRGAYLEQVRERLLAALALRDEIAPRSAENDACRLVFSEADDLPGIVADRYGDLVILQLLTQGTAQDDVRWVLGEVVREKRIGEAVGATLLEGVEPPNFLLGRRRAGRFIPGLAGG